MYDDNKPRLMLVYARKNGHKISTKTYAIPFKSLEYLNNFTIQYTSIVELNDALINILYRGPNGASSSSTPLFSFELAYVMNTNGEMFEVKLYNDVRPVSEEIILRDEEMALLHYTGYSSVTELLGEISCTERTCKRGR